MLLQEGRFEEGTSALDALSARADLGAAALAEVGQLYTSLHRHPEAERCFARAVRLQPRGAAHLYNWATALIALGRLEEAEATLDRVIDLNPQDADAYYNRATLRRQTPSRNHVQELRAALGRRPVRPGGSVALCYALAKELEDLADYPGAFAALREGAATRRRMLSYRIEDDEHTMARVATHFDAAYFSRPAAGCPDARPIFIVGLPRSGTTVVDRILDSHSRVESRGESNEFARVLVQAAGPTAGRDELIARTAQLDLAPVGESYCRRLGCAAGERSIDKNPVNFLYLGLIARALPAARIIHVRRDPMDVCYAMYKTLFRMAYPFSYDLSDLARYHHAYERLMNHWRAMLPGSFLDVSYEALIADQERVTRGLLEFCGLPWEEGCLHFERNEAPCLTASAAQVRQPLYSSSVGQWRRYASELEPLRLSLARLSGGPLS